MTSAKNLWWQEGTLLTLADSAVSSRYRVGTSICPVKLRTWR
jgi:hypothetical protein